MIRRREFFKIGLAGSLILGGAYSITKSLDFKKDPNFKFFDQSDIQTLKTFIPVILDGNDLSSKEVQIVLENMEKAILGLSIPVQKEVSELLLLFKWRLLRWSSGRNSPWHLASFEEIDELLVSWSAHHLELYRSAYSALCELVNASYYSIDSSWEKIGYPGVPDIDREGFL